MKRLLKTYYLGRIAGILKQNIHGELSFEYANSWLDDASSAPLSQSLPLVAKRYSGKECTPFFGGILPESDNRDLLAKNLGISRKNDYAMLERTGGECPGAVTFVPMADDRPEGSHRYRALDDAELASVLRQLPSKPLMAGARGVRQSLAGAQDKLAVHIADGAISLPLGDAPSTHILKPAHDRYDGLVFNEALCMKLAAASGLRTAEVAIGKIEDIDYLLVKRYDRMWLANGSLDKLHQEDFCQALGVRSERKYQCDGGPSLAASFDIIRRASCEPDADVALMVDAVVYNYLIGNNDAHGKNFSLLYGDGRAGCPGSARLAPLYDLLNTSCYPGVSTKMSMKIGREYQSAKVGAKQFELLAAEAGLPWPIVRRQMLSLAESVLENLATIRIDRQVEADLAKLVHSRCERFIRNLTAKL